MEVLRKDRFRGILQTVKCHTDVMLRIGRDWRDCAGATKRAHAGILGEIMCILEIGYIAGNY